MTAVYIVVVIAAFATSPTRMAAAQHARTQLMRVAGTDADDCLCIHVEPLGRDGLDLTEHGAATPDPHGHLPLHWAAYLGSSPRTVQMLIAANPASARAQSYDGKLPLHLAVDRIPIGGWEREDFVPSLHVVRELLDTFPEGARTADMYGLLPLHLLVVNPRIGRGRSSSQVVGELLEAFPGGAARVDRDGNLPLHLELGSGGLDDEDEMGDKERKGKGKESFGYWLEGPRRGHRYIRSRADDGISCGIPLCCCCWIPPPCQECCYECRVGDGDALPVLRELLHGSPGAVREADGAGRLPLHLACYGWARQAMPKPSPAVVRALLRSYPEGAGVRNEAGLMPLHLAVRGVAVLVSVVKDLLGAYPEAAGHPGGDSAMLPLHMLCANRFLDDPVDMVRALLMEYRDGARIRDGRGMLPLNYLMKHGGSLNSLKVLLAAHPGGAANADEEGMLPLHRACRGDLVENKKELALSSDGRHMKPSDRHWWGSMGEVNALLEAHPEGAGALDRKGLLPIHYAISMHAPDEIVIALLEAYPGAAKKSDGKGDLPLHIAAAVGASVVVLDALLSEHRGAAGSFSKGPTPLLPIHAACSSDAASPEIVRRLLAAYPAGAKTPERHKSCLPIHLACRQGSSSDIVARLLEFYPDGASERDNYSRLPLHLACGDGSVRNSPEIVRQLLKLRPEGAREEYRGMLPLHLLVEDYAHRWEHAAMSAYRWESEDALRERIAEEEEKAIAIMQDLLKAFPEAAEKRTDDGKLPLHMTFHQAEGKVSVRVVHELLDCFPNGAVEVDNAGKTPLHYLWNWRDSEEAVLKILDVAPKAVTVRDREGKLPVDIARSRRAPAALIHALAAASNLGNEDESPSYPHEIEGEQNAHEVEVEDDPAAASLA